MNTLKILLRSVASGGLNASALLGKHFGGNGDYIGYWAHQDDAGVIPRDILEENRPIGEGKISFFIPSHRGVVDDEDFNLGIDFGQGFDFLAQLK